MTLKEVKPKYNVLLCEPQNICWLINPKVAHSSIQRAFESRDTKRCTINNIELLEPYFRFLFVRNPWDRLVSLYKNLVRIPQAYVRSFAKFFDTPTINKLSFDNYIEGIQQVTDKEADHHFRSQHLCLPPLDPPVHFLGRLENMEEDWVTLQTHKALPKLLHINKSKGKNYQTYYSETSQAIVAERYKQDIEVFNYDF